MQKHTRNTGDCTLTSDTTTVKHSSKCEDLLYCIHDNPPWHLCIILGFQHFLTMLGGTIAMPFILSPALCITDTLYTSELIATGLFVSGIVTLLQVSFGIRLPIVQGGTPTFLVCAFAILSLPKWQCPNGDENGSGTSDNTTDSPGNVTNGYDERAIWTYRMRELQGAIMVAALFQVIIGLTGLVSVLVKYVGPIVIASTITMIALSLFKVAALLCQTNWWIALFTIVMVILFSQYITNFNIPCCQITKKTGCKRVGFPLFKFFPIILSMMIAWCLCAILTTTNAFPNDPEHWTYLSRTDIKTDVLKRAKWIDFPYPGQWGMPTVSIAGVFGMLTGVVAGVVESIGDYYACARLSGAPPPPSHAINRGVLIEGIGCIISGACGSGAGTTSYSENVGSIGITKVGNRKVVMCGSVLMIILAVISKFAAFFATMPDAIIGGVLVANFGMIFGIGVSNLQFVDMNTSRNLFVFGFSVFFGITLAEWMADPVHSATIKTGNETVDQIFVILLSTGMFVSGVIAFILDNTVPSSAKDKKNEEPLSNSSIEMKSTDDSQDNSIQKEIYECYKLPFGNSVIEKHNWTKYIPLCPTFSVTRKDLTPFKKNRVYSIDTQA